MAKIDGMLIKDHYNKEYTIEWMIIHTRSSHITIWYVIAFLVYEVFLEKARGVA